MRLTTKFSAFITLLTGLTIFVTLIGCSLSFYNAVQYKYVSRVQATATAIDTHLVTHDIVSLTPQIDELMIASDIVRVDLLQGERSVYSHSRARGYRPAGTSDMYRELVVPLIKHPGMSLRLAYQDPMGNYFHSLPASHAAFCQRLPLAARTDARRVNLRRRTRAGLYQTLNQKLVFRSLLNVSDQTRMQLE